MSSKHSRTPKRSDGKTYMYMKRHIEGVDNGSDRSPASDDGRNEEKKW